MELRVLKYFTVVVQEGNFSRAANVLHVSESTLSRQIQNLEEELNTQLLLRGNRSLKLTDSGQYLYSRTLEILQMAENTANTIQSGEKVVGNLHIGVGENYMETLVARAFAKLVRKYPDIEVNLHNITGDSTPNKVEQGVLDFGFVTTQKNLDNFYQLALPFKDHWGILVRKEDPLTRLKELQPRDLRNRGLLLSRQHGLINNFVKWLGPVKDRIRVVGTCDMMRSMHELVRNKVGLALTFDKKEYHEPNSSFAFLPLKDFAPSTSKLIWKKGRKQTKLEKLFLTEIKKEIKEA